MSEPTKQPIDREQRNGFFVNNGTFSGNFTSPTATPTTSASSSRAK